MKENDKNGQVEIFPSTNQMLRTIRSTLRLSKRQVEVMFHTDSGPVKGWELGEELSIDRLALIADAYLATKVLREILKVKRIPQVIRRPAEAFRGRCALDLILEGKLENVVAFYDDVTLYSAGKVYEMRFWQRVNERKMERLSGDILSN